MDSNHRDPEGCRIYSPVQSATMRYLQNFIQLTTHRSTIVIGTIHPIILVRTGLGKSLGILVQSVRHHALGSSDPPGIEPVTFYWPVPSKNTEQRDFHLLTTNYHVYKVLLYHIKTHYLQLLHVGSTCLIIRPPPTLLRFDMVLGRGVEPLFSGWKPDVLTDRRTE